MPPNYRQGEPLKGHERKGALLVLCALALTGAGIGAWQLASGGGGSKGDGKCVNVTFASSTAARP